MSEVKISAVEAMAKGEKKIVKFGEEEYLLIQLEDALVAVEPRCPHAGAPLEQGAVCGNKLVCPWHMGEFDLPSGKLLEPPPMRGLKTFAVRRDGADLYLNPEPQAEPPATVSGSDDPRTFLIVGLGAAGTMAALTLRKEGFKGRIVAVDPVGEVPIDRTQLSKNVLSGKMSVEKVKLDVLEELKIERKTARVSHFSAADKTATLNDGTNISFDAALIATGGKPKRLSIPGAELALTLRQPADAAQILEHGAKGADAVVVGTSFIGMECATSLTQRGLHVTVVGNDPALAFNTKFGDRIGNAIAALYSDNGVKLELNAETVRITKDAVTIKRDGAEVDLPASLVILGVGVEPEVEFKHDLSLADAKPGKKQDGSLKTDESLQVAPAVWIAGDIATVSGVRIEHWRLAEQHGMVAARAMLGGSAEYEGLPFFWTFHFGKRFGYLGHADKWDEIVYDGDVEALKFLAFYIKDGTVAAIVSCGRDHETATLLEPMKQSPTLETLWSYFTPS